MTKPQTSLTEYLQSEQTAKRKHELIDGTAHIKADECEIHNTITLNLASEFKFKLKGRECKPFALDMKVHAKGDVYYPDIVIVCQNHTDDTDYLINAPTLIVEVLSKSTRAFDHSVKQAKYLQLPSLEYYVLVEQDFCEVSVLIRAEGFIPKYYYLGQEIDLPLLDLSVSVDDIYDGIDNEDKQRYLASR